MSAPSPETSIFANDDSSKSAAVSRQARCSAPIAGDQFDLDDDPERQSGDPDGGTGGVGLGEVLGVDGVHGLEVVEIREVDVRLENVVERRPS